MWHLCQQGHLLPLPKNCFWVVKNMCMWEESHDKSIICSIYIILYLKEKIIESYLSKEFYSLKWQQQMLMTVSLFLSSFPVPYSSRKIPQPCNYSSQVDH